MEKVIFEAARRDGGFRILLADDVFVMEDTTRVTIHYPDSEKTFSFTNSELQYVSVFVNRECIFFRAFVDEEA